MLTLYSQSRIDPASAPQAYIGNGTSGKRYIGRFDTAEEAAEAYAEAFVKLNGRLSGVLEDDDDEDGDGMAACGPTWQSEPPTTLRPTTSRTN